MSSSRPLPKTILVFDVDGTLTAARQQITPEMREFLIEARKRVPLAVVGGSDFKKITEQLANHDTDLVLSLFDYVFSENGLLGFKGTGTVFQFSQFKKRSETISCKSLINFGSPLYVGHHFASETWKFRGISEMEVINLSPIRTELLTRRSDMHIRSYSHTDTRDIASRNLWRNWRENFGK
ncbi:hypothetical protein CRE_03504 [Caenorhabditis remanei]|uniref:Phosphomannomutase n=1 Tax=Caenorhabditis remanei TaxID=31234 RepID=E3NKP0_CAERE|nr:hypothetical protein CRE_03504 [Caenorhabditis remanei]